MIEAEGVFGSISKSTVAAWNYHSLDHLHLMISSDNHHSYYHIFCIINGVLARPLSKYNEINPAPTKRNSLSKTKNHQLSLSSWESVGSVRWKCWIGPLSKYNSSAHNTTGQIQGTVQGEQIRVKQWKALQREVVEFQVWGLLYKIAKRQRQSMAKELWTFLVKAQEHGAMASWYDFFLEAVYCSEKIRLESCWEENE